MRSVTTRFNFNISCNGSPDSTRTETAQGLQPLNVSWWRFYCSNNPHMTAAVLRYENTHSNQLRSFFLHFSSFCIYFHGLFGQIKHYIQSIHNNLLFSKKHKLHVQQFRCSSVLVNYLNRKIKFCWKFFSQLSSVGFYQLYLQIHVNQYTFDHQTAKIIIKK